MIAAINAERVLRAVFSAALLLAAAPAAFADPPGYDFMDFNQPPAAMTSAQDPAPARGTSVQAQREPQVASTQHGSAAPYLSKTR